MKKPVIPHKSFAWPLPASLFFSSRFWSGPIRGQAGRRYFHQSGRRHSKLWQFCPPSTWAAPPLRRVWIVLRPVHPACHQRCRMGAPPGVRG